MKLLSAKGRSRDCCNELKAAGEKVINFGVGEPDFNTPSHIIDAAKDALDKGYTKYVAAAGLPALKKGRDC
mgnify:CR=1 FL=1